MWEEDKVSRTKPPIEGSGFFKNISPEPIISPPHFFLISGRERGELNDTYYEDPSRDFTRR
jgi:hypothetical protein